MILTENSTSIMILTENSTSSMILTENSRSAQKNLSHFHLSITRTTWIDLRYSLVSAVRVGKGTREEVMDEVWKTMTAENEGETQHLNMQRKKNSISRNETSYFI